MLFPTATAIARSRCQRRKKTDFPGVLSDDAMTGHWMTMNTSSLLHMFFMIGFLIFDASLSVCQLALGC